MSEYRGLEEDFLGGTHLEKLWKSARIMKKTFFLNKESLLFVNIRTYGWQNSDM